MQMTLFHRRFAAWAACLAILMSALAPSVSHALALARGVDIAWMEVCSVAGTKLVKADTGMERAGTTTDAPASDALAQAGHCPYCNTHAASFALLPATAPLLLAGDRNRLLPLLFYRSPQPAAPWTVAQSRAPPVFS